MEPSIFAQACLNDPDAVILDTETTGLHEALIVEISVLGIDGHEILSIRLNPKTRIEPGATRVHGISDADVADCLTFEQALPQIERALVGKTVLIYNAPYDMGVLKRELVRAGIDPTAWGERARWKDVMLPYSRWVGEVWPEWSHYAGKIKWQKLPAGDHSAMGDCRATLKVLHEMCGGGIA